MNGPITRLEAENLFDRRSKLLENSIAHLEKVIAADIKRKDDSMISLSSSMEEMAKTLTEVLKVQAATDSKHNSDQEKFMDISHRIDTEADHRNEESHELKQWCDKISTRISDGKTAQSRDNVRINMAFTITAFALTASVTAFTTFYGLFETSVKDRANQMQMLEAQRAISLRVAEERTTKTFEAIREVMVHRDKTETKVKDMMAQILLINEARRDAK